MRGIPRRPENDEHLAAAVRCCEKVVLDWGVHAGRLARSVEVLQRLRELGAGAATIRRVREVRP
jgi:hypothetical protein